MLSVIIPAYNEEAMLEKTASVIGGILSKENIDHELIFVDDGSRDSTWQKIQACAQRQKEVRGVHFSRNFGKEAAIMAGLTESRGDCCVVIDCDLQHPPEKIPEMYALWQQGYEIVEGRKSSRGQEGALHALAARTFYSMISAAAGFNMADASDFKLLDRKAVNVLINMQERNAFFRALSSWVGFRTTEVEFDVQEREAGESKWSTRSLIRYAVNNITSFSAAPMQIMTVLGAIVFLAALIMGCVCLGQAITGKVVSGFAAVILIQLFLGGAMMMGLGIMGYYMARIYEEVKGRPRYIIASQCGGGNHEEMDREAV